MKVNKTNISPEDLVYQYLPADYADAYMCDFECHHDLSADDAQFSFWTDFPRWIKGLLKLRDHLVKPFGLKAGSFNLSEKEKEEARLSLGQGVGYRGMNVLCKSEAETVLHVDDKHLEFYFSVRVTMLNNNYKNIKMTTLVKFHNWLGRMYFFVIHPFHRIAIKAALKRVISVRSRQKEMASNQKH